MTTAKTVNGKRTSAADAATTGVKKVATNGAASAAPGAPPQGARPTAVTAAAKQKPKLVRDSFTIPKSEYAVLDALKLRAARLMRPTKKSEVLRAGIAALEAMSDKAFLSAINGVPSLKTGRPKSTATTQAEATSTQ